MRIVIIFFLFLSACSDDVENQKSSTENKKDKELPIFELNDTTFIHREIIKDSYHAIYIDTNRNAECYSLVTDFEFGASETEVYQSSYNYVKSRLPNSYKTIVNKTDIPKNWLPIHQYQDKYYLYRPSDLGNRGRRILNDNSFVFWYMDGPLPYPLLEAKKENDEKYKFKMADYDKETLKIKELIIHRIDSKTGLSVFEYPNEEKEAYRYGLYIPVESAKYFDVVVNYCTAGKQLEFRFDTVDYKKLLEESMEE